MWNFTSKLRQLVVHHKGLDSYSLPPLKDLEARKALCEKLTAKTYPFVWATLTVKSTTFYIFGERSKCSPAAKVDFNIQQLSTVSRGFILEARMQLETRRPFLG